MKKGHALRVKQPVVPGKKISIFLLLKIDSCFSHKVLLPNVKDLQQAYVHRTDHLDSYLEEKKNKDYIKIEQQIAVLEKQTSLAQSQSIIDDENVRNKIEYDE